ncbi:MAG TPA: hypothetical protein VFB01_16955 [Burkholderiales bacterium]|nr:hypothetical protein [Burkholderiales bacterium]
MLALRVVAILVVLAALSGLALYLFTRDRRYLRFAVRLLQVAVIFALFLFGLLALERIVALA